MKPRLKQYQFKADLTEEGQLEAVFSVFDVIDRDGDIVLASAIKNGKEIPLVWAHNWSMPIGKGTIVNDGKKATFKGQFFLDTTWGQDAYRTVRGMGDLQEYSWGFQVLEQEKGEKDGKVVNFIKRTEEFEVSPVLIGANRDTHTVEVKSSIRKMWVDAAADGSFEDLKRELNQAFRDLQFSDEMYMGYTEIVATYEDRFVALLWRWNDEEDTYWEVPYSKNEDGELLLGEPKQVEPEVEFAPVGLTPTTTQAMSFEDHSDYVRIAVTGLLRRSKTGSELRRAEKRALSPTRLETLKSTVDWLTTAADELQVIVDEPAPTKPLDGKALYAQFLRTESTLLGVPQ